jgi:RNA polymerase sigma-70 factor (ECF subfamily)
MSDVPRSLGGPPVARTAGEDRWPAGLFATTHWSVILNAQSSDSTEARSALEQLCGAYWYPVYAHVRRHGYGPDDACDHTQEFFGTLLRRGAFLTVEPAKGRFRTFLLKSLDHFLADQADRAGAAKRGAGQRLVELDALDAEERYALEPAVDETPDKAFDRRWAAALMERVFERLQSEQTAAGKTAQFERLKPFLAREVEPGEYEALEPHLGIGRNAIAAAVRRLRLRCRELALAEVMNTVAAPGEAEAELRQLFS